MKYKLNKRVRIKNTKYRKVRLMMGPEFIMSSCSLLSPNSMKVFESIAGSIALRTVAILNTNLLKPFRDWDE